MPKVEVTRPLVGRVMPPRCSPTPDASNHWVAAPDIPFEHRQFRLAAADQAGIEQLARLALARFGATMIDDDVDIRRWRAIVAAETEICLPSDAQIVLDRFRRRAGGARRAVQAVTDAATDTQRGGVDRDRDTAQ